MNIRIADRPITFPGNPQWLGAQPNGDTLQLAQQTSGPFKGFWVVQNAAGLFLSVQPNGSYDWVDAARGVYENFPTLADGCIGVEYGAPPNSSLPIAFKIPFSGI